MTLNSGAKLGPYEIVSPLGAGGMGEVYRAKDSRLGREVAIKVLPESMANDSEALARFEREAKAVAALSHPNILALHDIGNENGVAYAVMELLEGETLRARLNTGMIPPRKLTDYARQIAEGLAAAHEKGIVHRDLKPENLWVTADGRMKILDFGLAKLQNGPGVADSGENSPTRSLGTGPGMTLGTVGYMSPEQVRGEPADHRADIFSFGAVLYEMASGQRAFKGNSAVETMNAILKSEPPETEGSQTGAGLGLERIIRHCLEKNPGERFQSSRDLAFDLSSLSALTGSGAPIAAGAGRKKKLSYAIATLTGALLAAGFCAAFLYRAPMPGRPLRAMLLPPVKTAFDFTLTNAGSLAISPDGSAVIFAVNNAEKKKQLWLRTLVRVEPQLLNGTAGATFPFWSPDSKSVAFFADGSLKKIDVAGGPALKICDASDGRGGSWNSDGVILFAPEAIVPIHRVAAAGGIAVAVTTINEERQETTHRFPWFLPDGNHFLYLAGSHTAGVESEANAIFVATLDGKVNKLLLNVRSNPAYAGGRLFFVRQHTLMAQTLDLGKLQLTGDAVPVAESVQFDLGYFRGIYAVSQAGLLVYQGGNSDQRDQLTWYGHDGKAGASLGEPEYPQNLRFSRDGKRVAVELFDTHLGTSDLWVYEVARGLKTRLTFEPTDEYSAAWSPDGTRIIYTGNDTGKRRGQGNLFLKNADGTGARETLIESDGFKFASDWSRDGRFLSYIFNYPKSKGKVRGDIWILPMTGERKPFPFLQNEFEQSLPQFSPDGRWMAYISNESGRKELYVRPFPGPGGKWQISTEGTDIFRWQADGSAMTYLTLDKKLMRVAVAKGDSFTAGAPQRLFDLPEGTESLDIAPDGQNFLLALRTAKAESQPLTLVQHWDAELKK